MSDLVTGRVEPKAFRQSCHWGTTRLLLRGFTAPMSGISPAALYAFTTAHTKHGCRFN